MRKVIQDAVWRVQDVEHVHMEVAVLITHKFTQNITMTVVNLGVTTIHRNTLTNQFMNVTDRVQVHMEMTVR